MLIGALYTAISSICMPYTKVVWRLFYETIS